MSNKKALLIVLVAWVLPVLSIIWLAGGLSGKNASETFTDSIKGYLEKQEQRREKCNCN